MNIILPQDGSFEHISKCWLWTSNASNWNEQRRHLLLLIWFKNVHVIFERRNAIFHIGGRVVYEISNLHVTSIANHIIITKMCLPLDSYALPSFNRDQWPSGPTRPPNEEWVAYHPNASTCNRWSFVTRVAGLVSYGDQLQSATETTK